MMRRWHLAMAAALISCGGVSGVGTTRFVNQAPVWQVNDRHDTPVKPAKRGFPRTLYHFDGFFFRRVTRALELRRHVTAKNVNSLGEVPNSTWFTNRIGVRSMSVAEVRRGPATDEGPKKPFTILGTKVGGKSVGFMIKDANGLRYLLKFDPKGEPEIETAADVISARLLHACGFNVPDDQIVYFTRKDLIIAEKATVADTFGNKRKMTEEDLLVNLGKIDVAPNGRIRGLTSKFVKGVPLGGVARSGVRKDDPNDLVAHEHRRDLRGQYVVFSWINHTDVKEDNLLDMWTKDPANPSRRFVKHYLVDFGKALGAMGQLDKMRHSGFGHSFDFEYLFRSLLTFGLVRRPWEGLRVPKLRGVGRFESRNYEPGRWKSHAPWFAFKDKDRFDMFWGAKLIARFTPAHIRAAVEAGRYTDRRATDYVTKTLIERQRKTVRYWFKKVNPLDQFTVEADGRFCFDDLMVTYHLEPGLHASSYRLIGYDYGGKRTGWRASAKPAPHGRVCVRGLRKGPSHSGYTIVRVETRRRGRDLRMPVDVHLAVSKKTGKLRVIGLRRH